MLTSTLNTNEVKNSAGTEVEFGKLDNEGRKTIWAQKPESPSLIHRITINHSETGKSMKQRRRSVLRVDKTVISGVDSITPITVSAYIVLDAPVGAMSSIAEATNVLAELGSLAFTAGTNVFLYDGSGNGCSALLDGLSV